MKIHITYFHATVKTKFSNVCTNNATFASGIIHVTSIPILTLLRQFYALKVCPQRLDCISASADVIQTRARRQQLSFFIVKKSSEQKFQVQKNWEKAHFSDPVIQWSKIASVMFDQIW